MTKLDPDIQRKKEFLHTLRQVEPESFYSLLKKTHRDVFEKTDCLSCAQCCRTIPALVTRADIRRLATHTGLPPKTFIRRFVLTDLNGEMTLNGVPCHFLLPDNRCSVYEIRPEACRRYPHTDEREYASRPALNLANIQVCPAAASILEQLQKNIPAQ
jgi:Fe-S-cluster containining protein